MSIEQLQAALANAREAHQHEVDRLNAERKTTGSFGGQVQLSRLSDQIGLLQNLLYEAQTAKPQQPVARLRSFMTTPVDVDPGEPNLSFRFEVLDGARALGEGSWELVLNKGGERHGSS